MSRFPSEREQQAQRDMRDSAAERRKIDQACAAFLEEYGKVTEWTPAKLNVLFSAGWTAHKHLDTQADRLGWLP